MNKKQLNLQNASLFAELERKAKEIEILNIKLEEAENKAKSLNEEISALKESLDSTISAGNLLSDENEQLKAELEELKLLNEKLKMLPHQEPSIDLPENNLLESLENMPTAEEVSNTAQPETIDDAIIEETLTPPSTAESEIIFRPEASKSAPMDDMLRDYGAHIIGKVTRVTAEVLSKINSIGGDAVESLKTLALGKNESLKFQIMELAGSNQNAEDIKKKMNALAEEAIIYLKSI